MNEYDKQSNDFIEKTKSKLTIEYSRHDKHFNGGTEEEERDI